MLCFTLPESVSGFHFIREAFRTVLGGGAIPYIEPRLGLTRAFGSFDHPILYGTFCATALAATYYVVCSTKLRPAEMGKIGAVGLATFCTEAIG